MKAPSDDDNDAFRANSRSRSVDPVFRISVSGSEFTRIRISCADMWIRTAAINIKQFLKLGDFNNFTAVNSSRKTEP